MREKIVLKFDNKTNIVTYIWREPHMSVQGIVQISHGMAEHILRYEHFAHYLVTKGFIVIGADHYAHGSSANSIAEIGIVKDYDFMDAILKDMKLVRDELEEYFTGNNRILLGHSMGSMACQRYVQLYPNDFDKLVLIGTDIGSLKYYFAKIAIKLSMKIKGPISYQKWIEKSTMGTFNKKYIADHPKHGWISQNKENIIKYTEDPQCGIAFPANYYYSLSRLLVTAKKKKNLKLINPNLKILIVSGADDPVSHFGKSVQKLNKQYQTLHLSVLTKLYDNARHECLNENDPLQTEIYRDIATFMKDQNI